MAKQITVINIQRDPGELSPEMAEEGTKILPPPNNFPNFIVQFTYDGVPHKANIALELGGRDADFNFPEEIDPNEIADISETLMNSIYGSDPYKDAVEAIEKTF